MEKTDPVNGELTKSSFAAMAGVLLSRASGVIRTIVVNATFGVNTSLDAFNAAFRLPNSLRDLFADGALSAAFMTALVAIKQEGIEKERELISIVFGFFGALTLTLALCGLLFSGPIMRLITDSHFQASGSLEVAILLFQILVFYLPLTMLNAVVMAILGVHHQAFRAMNGSIFLSIGMICGALILGPALSNIGIKSIFGLGMGALLGAVLQMLYQMHPLIGLKLLPAPNFNVIKWFQYRPLWKILSQMAPRGLGQGAMVIALSINTYFATKIGVGFLTYIVTAITIIQVPIGLFGVATGFAALPALTSALSKRDSESFSRLLVEGLRTALWLASFATVSFALLIVPFYMVLFQHGKISVGDTLNNGVAVCIYATGITLASGNKVLTNALYALNATRQIVYNSIFYLLVNSLLNLVLAPRFGLIGIGFSFGVATSLDFWLNYVFIKHYSRLAGLEASPYQFGENWFTQKIVCLNIFGFLVCFGGVWMIHHFWAVFTSIFPFPLDFWTALVILVIVAPILVSGLIPIIFRYGPPHLKAFLNRTLRRLKRASKST